MRTINNDEELNRQLAIMRAAHEYRSDLAEQQNQAALPTKKLGRPGYVQTTPQATPGRELQALGKATLAGKELGGPESYGGQQALKPEEIGEAQKRMAAGQQEFYQPIPVTRGMTTTYQGPRYGTEYASPGQAAQAFRMEQGAKYVGTPSGKDLGIQTVIDEKTRQRNVGYFTNEVLRQRPDLFALDAKGEPQIKPDYMHLFRGQLRLAEEKPDDAVTSFFKEIQPHEGKLKEKKILEDPKTEVNAKANFAKYTGRNISNEEISTLKQQGRYPEFILSWHNYTPQSKPAIVPPRQAQAGQQQATTPDFYAGGGKLREWAQEPSPLDPFYKGGGLLQKKYSEQSAPTNVPIPPNSTVERIANFIRENPTHREFTKTLFGKDYGPPDEYIKKRDEYYGRNR